MAKSGFKIGSVWSNAYYADKGTRTLGSAASAKRSNVLVLGSVSLHSSRATADWLVPTRAAVFYAVSLSSCSGFTIVRLVPLIVIHWSRRN